MMERISERRRRQRIDIALPIKMEYNNGKRFFTNTKNISILGTYLESDKKFPLGTVLNIKMRLLKRGLAKTSTIKEACCTGIIFRCQPTAPTGSKNQYGIGIFFRSFLEKSEQALSNYISRILLQEKKLGKIYMQKRKHKLLKQRGGKR